MKTEDIFKGKFSLDYPKWLWEKPFSSQKWWQKSLKLAEKFGARYELGMTYLEMGRRLKEQRHLEKAESIFVGIGADFDLLQTRQILQQLREPKIEKN